MKKRPMNLLRAEACDGGLVQVWLDEADIAELLRLARSNKSRMATRGPVIVTFKAAPADQVRLLLAGLGQ